MRVFPLAPIGLFAFIKLRMYLVFFYGIVNNSTALNCRCSFVGGKLHLYLGRLGAVSIDASVTFIFIHSTYSQDGKPELPHHLGHTDHLFIHSL